MATDAYEALEEIYPKIVRLMPETFDSHKFILTLAHKYQRLYIQALYEHRNQNRPFHRVHMAIAKRLKKHTDLVEYKGKANSENIFRVRNNVTCWRRVK